MKNHPNRTDNGYSIKKGRRALILIASLFATIAVAVTCALSFGGYSKPVGVDNATNNGVSTSTTYANPTGDKSAQGALVAGDILTYAYSGSTQSITLPMGSFKIEAWGAAGGGADPGIGGVGGYMCATMKFTAKTTLTITVGQGGVYQNGTQSVGTRAYGGGGGGFGYGGGGGGGSFVDIGSTALVVAGGGGGAADTCGQGTINGTTTNHTYAVGRGGYPATHAGILSSGSGATSIGTPAAAGSNGAGGYGATLSGPGAGNGTSTSYMGTNGSGRQGGDGNKGSTNSGGGGGGGYYGGGGGGGDTAAGGGGCSYYNSSYVLSGTTYSTTAPADKPLKASSVYTNSNTGHSTGENGEVRITVVSVNQPPTQNTVALTTFTRGGTVNKTVTAANLATDPEGGAVYFTNGTSTNYDTYTNCTTNGGLYLDSACTVSANKFFTWTFSTNVSFNINGIKAFPRSGQTGVTAGSDGNTVRIYTKVRDNYGTNTTRAIATVYFDVKVLKNTMSLKSSVNAAVVDSAGTASTAGCMIGSSVSTPAPGDPASATAIYNPSGAGISTLFIKKTLMLGGRITLNAADLVNSVLDVDQAVIALTDTSKIISNNTGRLFKVTQLDTNASKVTTYNTGLTAIANTFSSITLECVTPTPGYQVLPVTVYVAEKAACNGTNVALWDANSGMHSYSFQIVFKMENTRPVLKSGVDNVVDLSVGETNKAIKLNDYFSDIDNASGITSSTHSILGVEIPKNEFIALDRLQNTVTMASPNQNYYNKGTKTADSFATTAKTDMATGFLDNIAYNATAGGTDTSREAFMRFTYSGDTLTVTGLRASFSQYTSARANAPGHFYLLLHIRDNCDALDNGIWLPLAFRVGATTAKPSAAPVSAITAPNAVSSQTKSSLFPKAAGRPGQSFYFAPMAVNYSGSHVVGLYKDSTGALTDADLQPLAIDGDNYATTTGLKSWNGAYLNEVLQLSSTPESVVKSLSSYKAEAVDGGWENQYIRAENLPIYIDSAYFPTALYGGGRIVVPDASLTAPAGTGFTVWSPTRETVAGKVYYVINGLKITLKSATMNRYLYADAGVTDLGGLADDTAKKIKIAVRVTNTALAIEPTGGNVAVYGDKDDSNAYSEYGNDGVPTLSYKIPLGTTLIVTPYDIAYDYDMQTAGINKVSGGFTLNGLYGTVNNGLLTVADDRVADGFNGLFDKAKYGSADYKGKLVAFLNAVNAKTTVGYVSNVADGTAATTAINANQGVYRDKLFFARQTVGTDAYTYNPSSYNDFVYSASNADGFVAAVFGNSIKIGDNPATALDFVMFSSLNRTSQPIVIDMTIADRYGNSADCNSTYSFRIEIEVVNTKPHIVNPDYVKELAVTPVSLSEGRILDNTHVFAANGNDGRDGLMADIDGDTPAYIVSRGVLIANTPDLVTIFRKVTSFEEMGDDLSAYTNASDGRPLTEYISATLNSNRELIVTALNSTKAIASGVYVYFFVTDNNGGTSLGYVQVEVVNTLPLLNTSEEDGFTAQNGYLWSIESTSTSDITRDRYVVGSEHAKTLLKTESLSEADPNISVKPTDPDIKLIANDADALHDSLLLSQITAVKNSVGAAYETINYVKLTKVGAVATAEEIERAVPSVGTTAIDFTGAPASVIVYLRTNGTDAPLPVAMAYRAELLFYVGGQWTNRADLITELTSGSASVMAECFDEQGRWSVDTWALHLRATNGFGSGADVAVSFSLRDSTELGGSTAGLSTAYNSNRKNINEAGDLDNRVIVDGGLITTVYQHISRTGIRSLNEFIGKNDDYYVVEYVDESGKATDYLSTYDGNKSSEYGSDDTVGTLSVGGKTIKERAEGDADNTLAGTNSGVPYATGVNTDGAFKYTDTIVIPAATTGATTSASRPVYKDVNVPMSYFGLMETLATPVAEGDEGSVKYNTEYVGYNVPGKEGVEINLSEFSTISTAISLSDGTTTWTGNTGALGLSNNPYINITPFYYDVSAGETAADLFADEYSKPYYNNRLAVTTINEKGELAGFDNMLEANKDSFVGDGTIMYLEEQSAKLIEHNFGLTFSKKDVRTGVRNLTLKINLAKCESGVITAEEDADRRTVEVKIRVENSMLDLYEHEGGVLKFDDEKGTYYVDILDLQSSGSVSYALTRRNVNGTLEAINPDYLLINPDIIKIAYTDEDFRDGTYRDYVSFSSESFESVDSWYTGRDAYKRATALNSAKNGFAYTAASDKAQRSVANYFGLTMTDGVYDSTQDGGQSFAVVDGKYTANGGMYGSTREGYSSYFNASTVDDGKILNITALRKTFINDIIFDGVDVATQEKVKAEYAKRGLVAEYDDEAVPPLKPSRVYYPLKVLLYDSCGAGWNDAAYTAIEFRITIVNGNPRLKNVGEEATVNGAAGRVYNIDIAVGNTATLNLYDFITDPDIFIMGTGGIYSLATDAQFRSDSSGVERETGDYLDSPIAYDQYRGKPYDPMPMKDGSTYYYNGGGFTTYESKEYENRDVVMWMETISSNATIPTRNYISFTVNRRTTAVYEGQNIYISQYRFTLNFRDSSGAQTAYIMFIVNITNQTPSIVAPRRSFTLRAGDDITVLTSYYDVFTGEAGDKAKAFASSLTAQSLRYRENSDGYGTNNGDGRNNAVSGYWIFKNITTDNEESKLIPDSTAEDVERPSGKGLHLGYLGLADDDTPWRLRISKVDYNVEKLDVNMRDVIKLANEHDSDSGNVAIHVTAFSACVNEPLTITIIDGEGGEAKITLYFTVISSPPVALDCADPDQNVTVRAADLEGVEDEVYPDVYAAKTFRLFTVPSDTPARYSVEGFPGETKLAKKEYRIPLTSVARDPDGTTETNNMMLYGNGNFAVGGKTLVADARGIYHADYFDISITDGGRTFVITSTGYNPDGDGYELLTFLISDYGNPVFANTLQITVQVYTLYSDILNPTVGEMDDKAYDGYLAGADVVNVVSNDDYYDTSKQTDKSKYAFVKLQDNVGNTKNTKSPIVDKDATKIGDLTYAATLYAFIDVDDGNITKLSDEKLKTMLVRTKTRNAYYLDGEKDYSDYIVGGIASNGLPISLTHEGERRRDAVLHYADFEFSADGTSLTFAPNSSTLANENVLLYVEAAKPMGDRMYKRDDAILQAGNLFRLNVIDSKPTAIGNALSFEGRKGDSDSFKVFDSNDLYGTLFVDADEDDTVSVLGIKDDKLEDARYKTVMSEAEKLIPGLKWQADGLKPRAFDISVDKDNNLIIAINRRIDYVVDGVSQPSVTFPIVITGVDVMGETSTTTIMLTIINTDVTTVDNFGKSDENGVGYEFYADEYDAYRMEVTLRYGIKLEVDLDEFMRDADIIEGADTDSYRYVNATASSTQTYLLDEPDYARAYELNPNGTINPDKFTDVALVEPLGDKTARTGIRFNAVTTQRNLTATIFVRIIDRSGSAEAEGNGITVKINVMVVNDAPFVKEGMENSVVYLMGSEKNTPKGMLFFIGDFIDDNNDSDVVGDVESAKNKNTYLRAFRQDSRPIENIYSKTYTSVVDGVMSNDKIDIPSSSLFTVTFPEVLDEQLIRDYCERHGVDYDYKDTTNNYRQWFVITPRQGYYGNGAIDVTVSDGDSSVMFDTLTTSFCVQVHVVCNPDEIIGEMNEIVIACGKTKTVDLKTLVPNIENKLVIGSGSEPEVITSADGDVFNQYEYYELVDIEFQNEVDKNKATFTKLDDGQTWELKAGNQITLEPVRVAVRFKLKNDPDSKIYRKYFYLTIVTNMAPQSIYSSITFTKNNTGEPDPIRDLDKSNTIRLSAWELFTDPDDPDGSSIRLLSVESQVSSIVKASIEKDESGENRYLVLKFVARGESEITVKVTDETGVPVSLKFIARNNDLPEGSMWVRISASFEAHTLVWIIVICCILLLLILLIILIAILIKRKQEREEIEALLVSEMEIEDQMLKLAGGSSAPMPGYQSYGFLPPTGEQPQLLDGGAPLGADGQPVQGLPSGQNDLPPDGTV